MSTPKHTCKICQAKTEGLMDVIGNFGLLSSAWICKSCMLKMMKNLANTFKTGKDGWIHYTSGQVGFGDAVVYKYYDRNYPNYPRANWEMWARSVAKNK
jgi:hypothetical protein